PAPVGGRGLLLTSDGIHGGMPAQVMEWVVRTGGNLQNVVERLVQASEWSGGHDNASVVGIGFQNGYGPSPRFVDVWAGERHLAILSDIRPQSPTGPKPAIDMSQPSPAGD